MIGKYSEHIQIICVPVEVVVENAEQRLESQSRQSVIAAGNIGPQIARLLQKNGGCQGQHQQRQPAIAQQEPTSNKTDKTSSNCGREQPADGFCPVQARSGEPDRVGADAEESGMPERHNSRIPENQVEREREHHHHQHLAAEGHARGKYEKNGNGDQPWQSLGDPEAVPLGQVVRSAFARSAADDLTRGHRTPPAL